MINKSNTSKVKKKQQTDWPTVFWGNNPKQHIFVASMEAKNQLDTSL